MKQVQGSAARTLTPSPSPRGEGSKLERRFAVILLSARQAIPPAEREYRFAPPRKWRFDFAWPAVRVAVELDGMYLGAGGGRHFEGADREKLAAAERMGWLVLHFTKPMLVSSAGVVEQVAAVLAARKVA